jgi:hypothetical protein
MTVNERLVQAGLLRAYEAARDRADLEGINAVLRNVDLHQDENGMNWSINAQD